MSFERDSAARHLHLVRAREALVDAPSPPTSAPQPAPRAPTGAAAGPRAGLEDPQLVALAKAGDRSAFEILYRRHAGFAFNLAVRIQGNSADVEDLVHDAFIKAHQRLESLRDTAAFRGWLGAIVVRLVHSRLRKHRLLNSLGIAHSVDPVDLDALASRAASPEVLAQLAQLYALLKTLPPGERIAWTLRHVEHHRLGSVAQLCGCSLATAKRRIQRAAQFLEEHFVSSRGVQT